MPLSFSYEHFLDARAEILQIFSVFILENLRRQNFILKLPPLRLETLIKVTLPKQIVGV